MNKRSDALNHDIFPTFSNPNVVQTSLGPSDVVSVSNTPLQSQMPSSTTTPSPSVPTTTSSVPAATSSVPATISNILASSQPAPNALPPQAMKSFSPFTCLLEQRRRPFGLHRHPLNKRRHFLCYNAICLTNDAAFFVYNVICSTNNVVSFGYSYRHNSDDENDYIGRGSSSRGRSRGRSSSRRRNSSNRGHRARSSNNQSRQRRDGMSVNIETL